MKRTPIKDKRLSFEDPGINIKVLPGSKVATIGFEKPIDELANSSLRSLAKIKYVTSQSGITLMQLSKEYPFDKLAYTTLHNWSKADNWVEARKQYKASLEEKVFQKLGQSHAQAITDQLEGLDNISDNMYRMLTEELGVAQVNSYEGMVNALVKLENFRFAARKEIAEIIKGIVGDGKENSSPNENLDLKVVHSKESIRQAAIAIIKANRDKKNA